MCFVNTMNEQKYTIIITCKPSNQKFEQKKFHFIINKLNETCLNPINVKYFANQKRKPHGEVSLVPWFSLSMVLTTEISIDTNIKRLDFSTFDFVLYDFFNVV